MCMILEELCGVEWRKLSRKYHTVGYRGIFGVVLADVKQRKYLGDNLRKENRALKKQIEELRQMDLFLGVKKNS